MKDVGMVVVVSAGDNTSHTERFVWEMSNVI